MGTKRKAIPKDNEFRRIRMNVEAIQWDGNQFNYPFALEFIDGTKNGKGHFNLENGMIEFHLHSPDGDLITHPGDWIVKESNGQCHPVKPFLFDLHYENVYKNGSKKAEE